MQADSVVGAIHQLFQIVYRLKQEETEKAKQTMPDKATTAAGNASDNSTATTLEVCRKDCL